MQPKAWISKEAGLGQENSWEQREKGAHSPPTAGSWEGWEAARASLLSCKISAGKISSAPFYRWGKELQKRDVIFPKVTILCILKQWKGKGNTGVFSPFTTSTSTPGLKIFLKSNIKEWILLCWTPTWFFFWHRDTWQGALPGTPNRREGSVRLPLHVWAEEKDQATSPCCVLN